jgi:hypothetical protein
MICGVLLDSALPLQDNVRELVIAHARPGLHALYDQHSYRNEKPECRVGNRVESRWRSRWSRLVRQLKADNLWIGVRGTALSRSDERYHLIFCRVTRLYAVPALDRRAALSTYQNEHNNKLSHLFPPCDIIFSILPSSSDQGNYQSKATGNRH